MKPMPLVFTTSSWYFPVSSGLIVTAAAASGDAAGADATLVSVRTDDVDALPGGAVRAAASRKSGKS